MGLSKREKYPRGNQFKLSKFFFYTFLEITSIWEYRGLMGPITIFSSQCIVALAFGILIPKWIGDILNLWGVCAWNFMMISVKG